MNQKTENQGYDLNIAAVEHDTYREIVTMIRLRFTDKKTADNYESAVKDAVKEFIRTDDGKKALTETCGNFNYDDAVLYLPEAICLKHGFRIIESITADETVDTLTQLI